MAGVVAVDLGALAGTAGTLSVFQAADPNLDDNTTFVRDATSTNFLSGALDRTYGGLTFSTPGFNSGFAFQTDRSESYTTGLPVLDSYVSSISNRPNNGELALDITGFAAHPVGQTITLTAFGVGDSVGQQTEFTSTFGSVSSTQETFYGTDDAGSGAIPFVQFTFTTDGITDHLNLAANASSGGGIFIPVNGISLSVTEPGSGLLPGAVPVINEFSASNASIIDDDNGNSTDFIEIFNAGDTAVNLAGYSLTDDPNEPQKYVFPSTIVGPGEYLVVFAGDDADPANGTDLFTGFGLSSSGDYLGFFNNSGGLVNEFGANGADFPAQFTDVSFGLVDDGSFATSSFFATPTPGFANVNPVDGVTSRVNSSVAPGFYEGTISVELTTESVGAVIFYTTDGSTPTVSNGTLYLPGDEILISSTTNLRAISVLPNHLSGVDRTYSYLFVEDILNQTAATTEAAGFPDEDNRPNGGRLDYGFDPEVLDIEGRAAVGDALLSLPSIAITTDVENLFDPDTGIYVNALQSGRAYERPASVELINPDGTEGFQVNAGLRIRGGFSRRDFNPKHSFRLLFRSEYGDSELNYPLHGEGNVDTFRNLDLRTAQNYSYNLEGDPTNNFIAEVISRQNQGLNGDLTTQSTYAHLYLNGQYWGLYQTQERAEADFAASYLGGDADDYDVVAPDSGIGSSRFIQATDGNTDAYFRLFDQADALAPDNSTPAFVDNAAYYRAQGLNPDGTRNPDFEVLLDVDNLINYITEIQYSGNFDSGISRFFGDSGLNNFQAIRDRTGDEGFRFFVHDAEHSLRELNIDRTVPFNDPEFDNARSFNPITLHQRLLANQEYRIAFADSIQEKFFNDGLYTTENLISRWEAEADKIRTAVIAESARWGDSHFRRTDNPILQSDFNNAINAVRDNILAQRNDIYLEQLRNVIVQLRDGNGNFTINVDAPLFPEFDAPVFEINGAEQFGGEITSGDVFTVNSSEAVYFTTDGSDPRLVGGSINPTAILYDPVTSTTTSTVFGFGSEWRFLDDGSNQGTAWRQPSFDDSGFSSGVSELGFGDNPATVTSRFGSNGDQVITTYFRKTFEVSESFDTAELELFYDDGAAVYLNGNLVELVNLQGPVNFQTLASSTVVDGTTTPIDVSNFLVEGTNTLAIEIHQASVTSSDLSFNAALTTTTQNSLVAIPLSTSTNIQARSFSNGEFSGLVNATFAIPGVQSDLRISELNFNPAEPTAGEIAAGFVDNDDFEFIEIFNPNAIEAINLSGAQLIDGVTFNFGDVDLLPGERAVVVEDIDAFMARYGDGDVTILGQYSGGLSNNGEEVVLLDSAGQQVVSIDYIANDPLLFAADGVGFSLVLDDLDDSTSLRVSTEFGGTPGAASAQPSGVVINEILANSDGVQVDAIELFNPTSGAIDISGYFLSDSSNDLLQYQVPAGTIIGPGGYLVFDESDFNATVDGFALSSTAGDEIFLSQASQGVFVGLQDSVEFGATFSGESLGRLPNGTGRLTRLASTSFGSANGDAEVGPLVISEINYNPADPSAAALAIDPTLTDNDLEFIEIANPTSAAIDLTGYRIRGEADFDFAAGTVLAAGQAIVVVTFDPASPLNANRLAAFEANYGIGANVTIVGGLSEFLSNRAGRVSLQQPDTPDALGVIPNVAIDEVFYTDEAPFPDADGSGQSLQRDDFSVSGNIASNWIAVAPTPGLFESEFLLGDVNQDGVVNFLDISPFIELLQSGDFLSEADIDGDGDVDFLDISPFINLLSSQ